MAEVSEELVKILVCPETKAPLVLRAGWLYSTDRDSRRRYPIREGIPIMLIDESEAISIEEFDRVMADGGRSSSRGTANPS